MKAKLIGALMAFLAGAMPAWASNCQHVVVQKQVEVVYPVVQQVQVLVPVYGLIPYPITAYTTQAVAPQPTVTQDDVLKELLLEIRSMRQEMRSLKQGERLPEPKQQSDAGAAVKAFRTNCAQCHSEAGAEQDGGGLILFKANGDFAGPLTASVARRIVDRLDRAPDAKGIMPPPTAHKMPDADRKLLIEALTKK